MLIVNISGMMQSVAGTKQPSLASLADNLRCVVKSCWSLPPFFSSKYIILLWFRADLKYMIYVVGKRFVFRLNQSIDIYNKPLQLLSTTFSCEIFELKDSTCYV